jgi:electron transfer DM13
VGQTSVPQAPSSNLHADQPAQERRSVLRRHPWFIASVALVVGGFVAFVLIYFDPQAALINTTVNEPAPAPAGSSATGAAVNPVSTAPQTLAHGEFRSLEHHTSGTATLLRLADGSAVLRLENLDTSNGPDVHVTLSPTPPDRGNRDYGDYLELGSLKANHGNQNYAIPAGTDVTRFRSAVIWCKRFSVGFGVAPLS